MSKLRGGSHPQRPHGQDGALFAGKECGLSLRSGTLALQFVLARVPALSTNDI